MNRQQVLSFLLFIILFSPLALRAGDTSILLKGRAENYSGDTIVFLSYSNMVSFTEMEMGRCAVDDSGFFMCSIPLNVTRHIFTHLGIYNCYLYAQPGMIYKVQLPRKREKSLADLVNPYFEETSVHLNVKVEGNMQNEPVPLPDEELNFSIRAFNDSFYPYYYGRRAAQIISASVIDGRIAENHIHFAGIDTVPGISTVSADDDIIITVSIDIAGCDRKARPVQPAASGYSHSA